MGDVRYRRAGPEDLPFLATMLGEAAVWRPEKPTPSGDAVLADPRYSMYLAGWPRSGDVGVIAERFGGAGRLEPVGAAWYRTYTEVEHGHGFVAAEVPELAIAVVAERRGEGIGRRLLDDLLAVSEADGQWAVSLSVREHNPARLFYESVGFVLAERDGTSWTMVRHVDLAG